MVALVWIDKSGTEIQLCLIKETPEIQEINGLVFSVVDGEPLDVSYTIRTDGKWRTLSVTVQQDYDGLHRTLELEVDGEQRWYFNGVEDVSLRGCLDVDLGITPASNTLPIKRLQLAPGESRDVAAAWVRFPALTVENARQRYTRLDERTYEYNSDTFTAEILVDEKGHITRYADLWELIGKTRDDRMTLEEPS